MPPRFIRCLNVSMNPSRYLPGRGLLFAAVACVVLGLLATWLALRQPNPGLSLAPASNGEGVVVSAGAIAGPPPGARLLALAVPGREPFALRASDLVEEPDFFDTYEQMAEFFARQSHLAKMLNEPDLRVIWADPSGEHSMPVTSRARTLGDLPAVFWFQLAVGSLGCLLGAWVFVLRPRDWSARMLALTGAMFPLFTLPAAIYSTRELALDGDLFRLLSSLNHFGAFMFGCALVALFLCYPRPMVRPRHLLWLPALFGTWLMLDILRLAPDQDWGSRLPVMSEMLLAIACGVVQWRRSKGRPAERAALRWLLLAAAVGCGLFVFGTVGAQLLGLFPPLSQGYAFGYFLIMYVGLALGIGRYRLFDLDRWAYRILLWVSGVVVVILLDLAAVWLLHTDPLLSLSSAVVVVAWVYLPLRHWLWRRLARGERMSAESLLPTLVEIAFTVHPMERESRWDALLRELYDPLRIEPASAGNQTRLADDGLGLYLPACGGLDGRRLDYAAQGQRLFSSRDLAFVTALRELMNRAAASRDAYERGANEERRRIARDMHDHVGSRLLTALHSQDAERREGLLRETLRDLRAIVFGLSGAEVTVGEALADLRHETAERLDAAGIALDWRLSGPLDDLVLPARPAGHLRALVREAVSNVLKHAGAGAVVVGIEHDAARARLSISVHDDGKGFDPAAVDAGNGLASLRARLAELGGRVEWHAAPTGGTLVAIEVPLRA